jgi:tetratricopeptide (TPR) repeat protein
MKEAMAEFAKIEKLKPDSPWLYYRRAFCHIAAKDDESAIADLERALECVRPGLSLARRQIAETLLRERGIDVGVPDPPPRRGL